MSRIREVVPVDDIEVSLKEEEFTANQLSIYPNPTKGGQINLKYTSGTSSENAQIVILNMQGQQLVSQNVTINSGENVIAVNLPNYITQGLYIIQLSTAGDQFSKTISVNKD